MLLRCIALNYITLHYIKIKLHSFLQVVGDWPRGYIALHYITSESHSIPLHYIAFVSPGCRRLAKGLHYFVLHYVRIPFHYIALHYITFVSPGRRRLAGVRRPPRAALAARLVPGDVHTGPYHRDASAVSSRDDVSRFRARGSGSFRVFFPRM
jgi:hypothetical protein